MDFMMKLIVKIIDTIAETFGRVAMVVLCLLVAAMMYEVIARYVFDAPTLWAFDISYMLNGSLFLIGGAYTLRADAHVRIDFLSQKMPLVWQQKLNAIFYLAVMMPIFALFSSISAQKSWKAFVTGEVENVSPWAPLVWPFYAAICLGLAALCLQFFAEGIRFWLGERSPGENDHNLENMEIGA